MEAIEVLIKLWPVIAFFLMVEFHAIYTYFEMKSLKEKVKLLFEFHNKSKD